MGEQEEEEKEMGEQEEEKEMGEQEEEEKEMGEQEEEGEHTHISLFRVMIQIANDHLCHSNPLFQQKKATFHLPSPLPMYFLVLASHTLLDTTTLSPSHHAHPQY